LNNFIKYVCKNYFRKYKFEEFYLPWVMMPHKAHELTHKGELSDCSHVSSPELLSVFKKKISVRTCIKSCRSNLILARNYFSDLTHIFTLNSVQTFVDFLKYSTVWLAICMRLTQDKFNNVRF
jgi:hypothetical protein